MSAVNVLISPAELGALMNSEPVVVIDTRDADTYLAGHIPGAVNLREIFTFLATSTAEGLTELKGTFAQHFGAVGLSGKETAVFYEDALNSGYGQSCRGYYLLTWLGYPKIKVLNGGYSAWKASGLATSTETVTPTPATFPTDLKMADVMLTKDRCSPRSAPTPSCSTCATSTSGSATAPRPTARTTPRARAASPARSGSSGTAS
jgi:thiosulfate/3-mercaptopyruvate sulfurtransferase